MKTHELLFCYFKRWQSNTRRQISKMKNCEINTLMCLQMGLNKLVGGSVV